MHWRKQHGVGTYLVDCYCVTAKLVVEAACPASSGIDGDSYADQIEYDQARAAYLNDLGYTVLRFTNREVLRQGEAVVQQIADECQRLTGSDQIQ